MAPWVVYIALLLALVFGVLVAVVCFKKLQIDGNAAWMAFAVVALLALSLSFQAGGPSEIDISTAGIRIKRALLTEEQNQTTGEIRETIEAALANPDIGSEEQQTLRALESRILRLERIQREQTILQEIESTVGPDPEAILKEALLRFGGQRPGELWPSDIHMIMEELAKRHPDLDIRLDEIDLHETPGSSSDQ